MRTTALISTLIILLAGPAFGQLTEIQQLAGRADCNGWSADATLHFSEWAGMVRLEYSVVLSDGDGVEVERVTYGDWLDYTAGSTATVSHEGVWTAAAEDGWNVRGEFLLLDLVPDAEERSEAAFDVALSCGDPGDDRVDPDAPLCTYPAGWWRRHQDAWPATELELGGQMLDEAGLETVMRGRTMGDPARLLARQLVAAKFNLMNNPQADLTEAVNAADAWLADRMPLAEAPRGRRAWRRWLRDVRQVRQLIVPLVLFNITGCPVEPRAVEEAEDGDTIATLDKVLYAEPEAGETVSFGELKARYR